MWNSIAILASLATLRAGAALLEDTESDGLKPNYDPVMHRFYGPWNTLHKRNGDYVDYNDYGGRIPGFSQSSSDLPRNGPPEFQRNLDEAPANYGDRLVAFNSDYKWKPMGLADFRTGIRSSGSKGLQN
ncbi:uncharacterized protein LOC143216326 [Lasioglossum baleicum]|uniref:uncharacterized protein LOC143216326 n=1 Tax=Lasioglossum baleicum TaxID=434251 RepID=UPI003FCCEE4E